MWMSHARWQVRGFGRIPWIYGAHTSGSRGILGIDPVFSGPLFHTSRVVMSRALGFEADEGLMFPQSCVTWTWAWV
jgi:hypothetical protein